MIGMFHPITEPSLLCFVDEPSHAFISPSIMN